MGKREDRVGKAGQNVAEGVLRRLGVEQVEEVSTPNKLIPHPKLAGYYRVIWGKKVSGDHRGVLPGGRSVLAEVKTIMDRNLCWSDLRPHQPGALSEHHEHGGLSLLVWVHSTGVYVMQWPVPGFGPGKSITPQKATALSAIDEDVWTYENLARVESETRWANHYARRAQEFRDAVGPLLAYRDANTLNFQLEKLDDYLRALRLLMEKQP